MIITIGGGNITRGETKKIDKYIISCVSLKHPRVLFIPTASHDDKAYIDSFEEIYRGLGCNVNSLHLCDSSTSIKQAHFLIKTSDIIYVGGGNTEFMMEKWISMDIDKKLIEAYHDNKVLTGVSAGSICWFYAGYSGSEFVSGVPNPKFKLVRGLNLIQYIFCPHYDKENRKGFDTFILDQEKEGIAVENQAGIIWDGYTNKGVIKSNPNKNAYHLYWNNQQLYKNILPEI